MKDQVDWDLEVGAIMQKVFDTQGPAVLFESVKDSLYPFLSGAMYTYQRYGLGIGVEGNLRTILHKVLEAIQNPIPPVVVDSGPCQENVLAGRQWSIKRSTVQSPKSTTSYTWSTGLLFCPRFPSWAYTP